MESTRKENLALNDTRNLTREKKTPICPVLNPSIDIVSTSKYMYIASPASGESESQHRETEKSNHLYVLLDVEL